jgi:uncharacterized protein (DUF1330 family)
MAAYVVVQMRVHDPQAFAEYASKVMPSIGEYNGKLLAANDIDAREGSPPFPRAVIWEFPTLEVARSWYESEAFQAVLPLRLASTTGMLFIVEGRTMPTEPHPDA